MVLEAGESVGRVGAPVLARLLEWPFSRHELPPRSRRQGRVRLSSSSAPEASD